MIIKSVVFGSDAYLDTIRLRDKILRKPLGMVFNKEDLDTEDDSYHIVCYEVSNLLGCLVLKPLNEAEIKMRQVAVDTEVQGKGIGKLLVNYSEAFALDKGFLKISLHARENALPFYTKLGYHIIGEPFQEIGLPHFKMEKLIAK